MSGNGSILWPLVVYFGLVVVIVGAMLGVSALLGQRHFERATGETYESGIVSTGSARIRFSSRFYLVAMFFVIFDLEAAFIFAWAAAAVDVGWTGYWEVVTFIGVLLIGLLYVWRAGGLDFGPVARGHERSKGVV